MSADRQVAEFDTDRFLAAHPVFSLEELREAMGPRSPSAVRTWLKFHGSRGRLKPLERGLSAPPPAAPRPEPTLVDGFRQLRLAGGLEELVTSAAGFASLDLEQVDAVL